MKHLWTWKKDPDTPDGPGEWFCYCLRCGFDQIPDDLPDSNMDEECPGDQREDD